MNAAFSSARVNPTALKRAAYCLLIVCCVAGTLALLSARERAVAKAGEASVNAAWQTSLATGRAATSTPPEVAFSRFNIKQAAANADLAWQATSASELRASLRALDAAQIKVSQIKITRSGVNFLVTAERAP
jgi:uncharacterized protein YggE